MLVRLTVTLEGHWVLSSLFFVPLTWPLLTPSVLCRISKSLILEEMTGRVTNVRLHRRDEMSVVLDFDCTTDGM